MAFVGPKGHRARTLAVCLKSYFENLIFAAIIFFKSMATHPNKVFLLLLVFLTLKSAFSIKTEAFNCVALCGAAVNSDVLF